MIERLVRRLTARVCPQCNTFLQTEDVDCFAVRFICPSCGFRWYTHLADEWLP